MKAFIFALVFLKCMLIIQGLLAAGPIGKIKFYKIGGCSKSSNVNIKWASNDDFTYKLDLVYTIPKVIDATQKIKFVFDKWEGGKWQKGAFVYEYKFCEFMFKTMKNAYNKAKPLSSPRLPDKCPIPAKTYSIKGFDFTLKDLGFPVIPYGKFYFTITVPPLCLEGEADSLRN